MKKIYIFSTIILLFYACEQTITIDIPDNGRKIVVNSILESDSAIKICVKQSKYILDIGYEYVPITEANVLLYEDGTEIGTASLEFDGYYEYYRLDRPVKEGSTYRVEIDAPNHDAVSALCGVPFKATISNLEAKEKRITTSDLYSSEGIEFKLNIHDKVNEENYYYVTVENLYRDEYIDWDSGDTIVNYHKSTISVESEDPSVIQSSYLYGILLSDELFDGEVYNLIFYSSYWGYYSNGGSATYYVSIKSISKDLYLYYRSLSAYNETNGNPFAEPVQVFNNIDNGLGIFAGSSVTVDSVFIENQINK